MLSVIEKVILLQRVDVFGAVPTDQLAHLATVTSEVPYEAQEDVFRVGDPANSMFVVLEGQVRLSRGGATVTIADVDDAFGAWSLFDDEPRVVDAVATRATLLLKLEKADFLDLLADNVEITQGVLKGIVTRLRGVAGRASKPADS